MRKDLPTRRVVLTAAASLVASTCTHALPSGGPGELKFGLTPVCLTSDLELLAHLRSYLERFLARPVRLVTRRTYQEITALLVSGQLDAAWICGFPAIEYRTRLAISAVPIWRGKSLYQSYLIADRSRTADDLDDLRGDMHAFSDPNSNSGWLVTAAELAGRGLAPQGFFRGTFFTWGHRNVVRAVTSGLADSGSVDGYVYEVMRETEPDLVAGTRVVRRSEWLPFPPVAVAAGTAGSDMAERLGSALRRMAEDEEGRAVLRMLRLDGFQSGDIALYDPIAAKTAAVRRFPG
ncbi:phosphonate ABC transporter substrate-binding protein [Methylorubrum extorquens]|uniref:Phosphonate ABC transporter substrate-binding protein n=1 Tax=Methylorubrum extorquens TaxID=408 RepID=A0A1S1PC52_METEX|nr:phosphonate ABC transporter substrate-binding protein [Methylorubrum extorquens]